MKRRDAREAAFLLIFEKSFREEPMDELITLAVESRALELNDYARRLVLTVDEKEAELDQNIEKHLTKWKITRLARVTLAVLRLAVCELSYFPDIPVRVTINEAIELAKKYATENDASYINGVLGSFVKEAVPVKNKEADENESCLDI
ncbi:transcription antitermination factor NusB [Oscillospiraceae bacterium LTW-04]|nr:transcription antitermination factor NusB [Oscillospiraceae bacterium MB24-C1]